MYLLRMHKNRKSKSIGNFLNVSNKRYMIFLAGILNQFSAGFTRFVEDSPGGDVRFGVHNSSLGCIL